MPEMKKGMSEPNEPRTEFHVDIFRHGKAKYLQDQVPIEEADDLTPEGEVTARQNAEKLADLISSDEEVAIWASPTGRTLKTAKIVAEVLRERGIRLRPTGLAGEDGEREVGTGIKVFQELADIKNFSRELFLPVVDGGEVSFAGHRFAIDKAKTNPRNLGYAQYWIDEEFKKLPAEVRNGLPEEFVAEIDKIEEFYKTTERIIKPLARLNHLQDKAYRIIIVTHGAMGTFIARVFADGETIDLQPGEFIDLERRDNKFVATRVGSRIEGNDADVIEEFKKEARDN